MTAPMDPEFEKRMRAQAAAEPATTTSPVAPAQAGWFGGIGMPSLGSWFGGGGVQQEGGPSWVNSAVNRVSGEEMNAITNWNAKQRGKTRDWSETAWKGVTSVGNSLSYGAQLATDQDARDQVVANAQKLRPVASALYHHGPMNVMQAVGGAVVDNAWQVASNPWTYGMKPALHAGGTAVATAATTGEGYREAADHLTSNLQHGAGQLGVGMGTGIGVGMGLRSAVRGGMRAMGANPRAAAAVGMLAGGAYAVTKTAGAVGNFVNKQAAKQDELLAGQDPTFLRKRLAELDK